MVDDWVAIAKTMCRYGASRRLAKAVGDTIERQIGGPMAFYSTGQFLALATGSRCGRQETPTGVERLRYKGIQAQRRRKRGRQYT